MSNILDAVRTADGRVVALKKINKDTHPYEAQITESFSSEALVSDPANHAIPLYEVLQSPIQENIILLVMPWLVPFAYLRFATIGEVVAMMDQIFEVGSTLDG